MAFGTTGKYVKLRLDDADGITEQDFNNAIIKANEIYKKREHNICCDNCHSHVARALNIMKYKGRTDYTMVSVWWLCITQGRYVSCAQMFAPYYLLIIVCIIIAAVIIYNTLSS